MGTIRRTRMIALLTVTTAMVGLTVACSWALALGMATAGVEDTATDMAVDGVTAVVDTATVMVAADTDTAVAGDMVATVAGRDMVVDGRDTAAAITVTRTTATVDTDMLVAVPTVEAIPMVVADM
jgi:hypothetical protein